MSDDAVRETCSINGCLAPAIHSEHGQIGPWEITLFYCDEHARQLREGTPLGGAGIDPAHIRIEPVETSDMPGVTNRFPGIG